MSEHISERSRAHAWLQIGMVSGWRRTFWPLALLVGFGFRITGGAVCQSLGPPDSTAQHQRDIGSLFIEGINADSVERQKALVPLAGVNFEFRYFPNQDITLVVFSNQNNGAYDDLKRNTIKLISGDR